MSVHTQVNDAELSAFLRHFEIGSVTRFTGITQGVTNTIYDLTTDTGRFILTLFEELTADDLPFYITLMNDLNEHGIRCPQVVADQHGHFIHTLNDKPAILTAYLPGDILEIITPQHCYSVGVQLAKLHQVGQQFSERPTNPRGLAWCEATAKQLVAMISTEEAALLTNELAFQHTQSIEHLPHGIIHADLFPDNVLFDQETLTGFIDFYYACYDPLIFDVAITTVAWCQEPSQPFIDDRYQALSRGYQTIRPVTPEEQTAWPAMLRRAALRFWISRLYDYHHAKHDALIQVKPPEVYEVMLRYFRQ